MAMSLRWNVDKAKMLEHHILFMDEDKENYTCAILSS